MNRNAKIVVVVPVGPKDDIPKWRTKFPWLSVLAVVNGRDKMDGEDPAIYSPDALGITEAHRQGVNKALELEPDIICLCYSAAYRKHLNGILDFHLFHDQPVTITCRRPPRWEKWTGKVGSRAIHYASRWLLGLPFQDNCSGLYVFTVDRPLILRHIFRSLKSRDHFFDTEFRYRILKYFKPEDVAEYYIDDIVTGGNTLNWAEIKDTAVSFGRLLWDRIRR